MKRLSLALLLAGSLTSWAAERGAVAIRDPSGEQVGLYKESHALVIGVSVYMSGWPSLRGVKGDVEAVKQTLEQHGFNVELVRDPDQAQLEAAYEDFILDYGLEPENRLLFYFAGHGHTEKPPYATDDPEEWMGYIVSRDAPLPSVDLRGFLRNAMSMQRFEELAKQIRSKHALFVFDSCFSGSVFSLTRAVPADITRRTARSVRQFITSGSADQQVPDVSVFRRQFIAALEGEGDLTGDGYVTASELGRFLEEKVANYTKNAQTPQYGKLRHPRLDKGDFVFVAGGKPGEPPATPVTPPRPPQPPVSPTLPFGPPAEADGSGLLADSTFLDVSQRQNDWYGLTSWLRKSGLAFEELRGSFSAENPRARMARVLILTLPFQEHLSDSKIANLKSWVERGGGLLVLGYYAPDIHHGSNPSRLTREWGITFNQHVLLPKELPQCDRGHVYSSADRYAVRIAIPPQSQHPLVAKVAELALVSSASLDIQSDRVQPELVVQSGSGINICNAIPTTCGPDESRCAIRWEPADSRAVPVMVAFGYGLGRVAIVGTWKIANPDHGDNKLFMQNLIEWLGQTR